MIFTNEKVNTGRQIEIDFAKALAIFFMVIIHVYEEMSNANFEVFATSLYENVLQFCAGPMAAPVFMFAMGVGIIYSRHNSPKELFDRGLKIFIVAYILNICRDVIPYTINCLISAKEMDSEEIIYLIFNVDILQFAGLAHILIAFLKKINFNMVFYIPLVVVMQVIGQIFCFYQPENMLLACLLGLFYYTSGAGYFPILQWFVFPVLGMIFGEILQRTTDKDKFYKILFIYSFIALTSFIFSVHIAGFDIRNLYSLRSDIYYYQGFYSRFFTLFFIYFELSAIYLIHKAIHNDIIDNIAIYLSKNLNTIYVIQWLIIGILTHTMWISFNDLTIDVTLVVPVGLLITFASIMICKLLNGKIKFV